MPRNSSTDNGSKTGVIVGIVLGVLVLVIVVVVSICLCARSSAASRDAEGDEFVCHQPPPSFNTGMRNSGPSTMPMSHYGAVQPGNFEAGAPPADMIGGGQQPIMDQQQGGFQQVSHGTGHENVIAI